MASLRHLPLIVLVIAVTGALMFVPMVYGLATGDRVLAAIFAQSGTMVLLVAVLLAIATTQFRPKNVARSHFLSLLAAYAVVPFLAALPMAGPLSTPLLADEVVARSVLGTTGFRFFDAWFEMVSSFTTTGATLIDRPGSMAPGFHLWRALVGWLGGFVVLFAAAALLAPVNLGGVEVETGRPPGRALASAGRSPVPGGQGLRIGGRLLPDRSAAQGRSLPDDPHVEAAARLWQAARLLAPVYAGLTLGLWIGLILAGDTPLVAACHAMSVLATSGISPVGGLENAGAARAGEMLILVCFVFAFTRHALPGRAYREPGLRLRRDHEFRAAVFLLSAMTLLLFIRQFAGAAGGEGGNDALAALRAFWGSAFTFASFLSTTGFVSADWEGSRLWSGLPPPGLALAGLALVGGGVATTAGGVRLLRAYALYRHGLHEMEKLLHPSLVAGRGARARRIRTEGAYAAWLALMLLLAAMAAVMAALSLAGVDFEPALILTIAALSTTGPLAEMVTLGPILYSQQTDAVLGILGGAMVIGRLELLAVIALLAPSGWRA